jgi:uncharacterized membrane protein YczE
MKIDMFIQITTNPNTYSVSYITFDDDGITINSTKKTTYIAHNVNDIVKDLLNTVKPSFYKVYVDDILISQLRD